MELKKMELVLIRHGVTRWNQEKRYLGHTDLGLTEEGREGLAPLREKLADQRFAKVFSSDLKRCRESLAVVAPHLVKQAIYDSRLREMDFGEWEGRTYEELKSIAQYREWLDHPQQISLPGGESWNQFAQRLQSFLHSMIEEVEDAVKEHSILPDGIHAAPDRSSVPDAVPAVLVMTHGGVIRSIVSMLVPGSEFWEITVKNGGLSCISLEHGTEGWTGTIQGI